jgi:Reverse transcriptase (RNA-dependent DNA polymerase)
MVNINGMKEEVVMGRLKQLIYDEEFELTFVTEAHLSKSKEIQLKAIFSEYDVFVKLRRKKKKRKQYHQRGGVVCIASKGIAKLEKETKCDDLMCVKWRDFVVLCAYFVPPSSPFEKKNAKRMREMQQRILECHEQQKIIMLTDANAWIGESPSTVSRKEDGYEREVFDTYERKSEKKEVNKQGEWFISSMNDVDMIVLNGIKSEALCTYDHPGREAKSVIDFVAANKQSLEVVSDVMYQDCRESLSTDHLLISINVQCSESEVKTSNKPKPEKRKSKKPIMECLKTITRKDPFWKVLEGQCEGSLSSFNPTEDNKIDDVYEVFKAKLTEAVTNALALAKPQQKVLKARLKSKVDIVDMRIRKNKLYREVKAERDAITRAAIKKQVTRLNKQLKKRIREEISMWKREQVKEIEDLEVDDCRRMWKELKTLCRWNHQETVSDVVLNEEKQEVSGEEVKEVWKEAFRVLGIEDEKDARFDIEFGKQITKEQERIEEESHADVNFCAELDDVCSEIEVREAIQRLKLGKTSGKDEIVSEVLKRGGDKVEYAVYLLCVKVWEEEKLPKDWTKGIICPIYKDGDKRDTSNYRGITLLSIVGKVYAQIINERLMRWSERNKVLVEEQGGFRPHRGCPDQLFSLVEILQNRGKQATFCCFIDVKKAFDRVFRAGLWKRIAEEGVRGKMWRIVKSVYETVESCVKVDQSFTDWFVIETGVRQGCVLSPLLYALFINGLVKELNTLNLGIKIRRGKKLCSLLYADDIVLMAEDRESLQRMLDTVAKYAKRWRFELNPKKSEVVVFGVRDPPRNVQWKLGENVIKQVNKYKYLGIEITRTLKWHPYLKRILAKARRNMTQALAMGISGGFMTVRLANIIWMSLVRSIIEYGCEIWGEKEYVEFEKLQLEMGKRILRCGSRTSDEVVRGELGWERQRARRDEMRLRYWAKIVRMTDDRIAKIIYRTSKNRLERQQAKQQSGEEVIMTKTWCKYTKHLLQQLQLEDVWETEQVGTEAEWNELVRERIHHREQIKWRTHCLMKPKLRTYVTLKKELKTEPFLDVYHRGGTPELVKVRGGTNRLRIEQGRYVKEAKEERTCVLCNNGRIEDEKHFILECQTYEELRGKMWRKIESITGEQKEDIPEEEKLNALIGDRYQSDSEDKNHPQRKRYEKIARVVMAFITTAMSKRRKLLEQDAQPPPSAAAST